MSRKTNQKNKRVTRWILVVHLVFLGFISIQFISRALAAEPSILVRQNEPFALRLDNLAEEESQERLKVCFSDSKTDPLLSKCEGTTWNSEEWLTRSDAWVKFPVVNSAHRFLVGESQDAPLPYLHVVRRNLLTEKNKVVATYSVKTSTQNVPVWVQVFTSEAEKSVNNIIVLSDEAGERYLPNTDGSVLTSSSGSEIAVAVEAVDGVRYEPYRAHLLNGLETNIIRLNGPAKIMVRPHLRSPHDPRINQDILVSLETEIPYTGAVAWAVNGVDVSGFKGSEFHFTPTQLGVARITATLETGEQTLLELFVNDYRAIRIQELLPNPDGRDTSAESLTLQNNNDYPAVLRNWKLVRRSNEAVTSLSLTLLPTSTQTITLSNKLVNSGDTYDLLSSTGALVDSVTYLNSAENERWERRGLELQSTHANSDENSQSEERANVKGVVMKPSGQSFDMQTQDGEQVHVVVHTSMRSEKPRLHAGDVVEVQGEWRIFRGRKYVSVRMGGYIRVLVPRAVATKSSRSQTLKIESQQQNVLDEVMNIPKAHSPPVTFQRIAMTRPWFWRWGLSVILSVGILCVIAEVIRIGRFTRTPL